MVCETALRVIGKLLFCNFTDPMANSTNRNDNIVLVLLIAINKQTS